MATLAITSAFDDQLDELAKNPIYRPDIGLIDALLDELCDDHEMLGQLQQGLPNFHWQYKPPFEIKRFAQAWAQGRRVFILKFYDEDGGLSPLRVFLGYDITSDEYVTLCTAPRHSSYHPTGDNYRLLCERYRAERIPTFGR